MMYGFKQRFVAPILAGTKTGTIRAPRAGRCRHARPGNALQLKSGPRFRPVVFADTTCTGLFDIHLCMGADPLWVAHFPGEHLIFSASETPADLDSFAIADGFTDWEDLCRFWWDTHKVKDFAGSWIRWAGAEVKPR